MVADEPTTALDVTVQAEILDLMAELKRESGAAMVLVTHDMPGVIPARLADRVAVMKDGAYVEEGPGRTHLRGASERLHARALLRDAIPGGSSATMRAAPGFDA